MPATLRAPAPAPIGSSSADEASHDGLRALSRSPHPYHRLPSELLEPTDRVAPTSPSSAPSLSSFPSFAKESPLASESGTEADDEHFLKGLPAPRARLHKGLRGRNEQLSGTSTPLPWPAVLEEEAEGRKPHWTAGHGEYERGDRKGAAECMRRRRRELVRRVAEVLLLACQARMVASNPDVRPLLRAYCKGNY